MTTIPYTLPSGKSVAVTVAPSKNWDGTVSASITAAVAGVGGMPENGLRVPAGLPGWAVSAIGRVPLTAEVDAQVRAAKAAIDAAHTAHNAAAKQHLAELEAVTEGSKRLERAMACGE